MKHLTQVLKPFHASQQTLLLPTHNTHTPHAAAMTLATCDRWCGLCSSAQHAWCCQQTLHTIEPDAAGHTQPNCRCCSCQFDGCMADAAAASTRPCSSDAAANPCTWHTQRLAPYHSCTPVLQQVVWLPTHKQTPGVAAVSSSMAEVVAAHAWYNSSVAAARHLLPPPHPSHTTTNSSPPLPIAPGVATADTQPTPP
jgi:hypothetical protein